MSEQCGKQAFSASKATLERIKNEAIIQGHGAPVEFQKFQVEKK